MRDLYNKQLEELKIDLTEMGGLCEEAITHSIRAMLLNDNVAASKSISFHQDILRKENDIEQVCIDLIQTQQPVAGDLRLISAALKIITDMKRIGDQSADIAEIARHGNGRFADEKLLAAMSKEAATMVTDSIDAFVHQNLEKAKAVIDYDDVVDNLFNQVKMDMVRVIVTNPDKIEYVVDMLMIAKYFEKIADHAVNIAEWAAFAETGDRKGEKVS